MEQGIYNQCQNPNKDFFQKYGELENEDSTLMKSQFLFIRHAISNFNIQADQIKKIPPQKTEHQVKKKELYLNRELIDALLHENGIQQAIDQQSLINKFNFRVIFVSPHRRTIQTTCYILQQYPNKQRIKIILLPIAKEILNNSNDLPIDYEELIQFVKQMSDQFGLYFDTSCFNEFQIPSLWYLQILTNDDKKKQFLKISEQKHHHEACLDYIEQNNCKQPIETNHELFQRVTQLKIFLHKYIHDLQQPLDANEKILIVTHSKILQAFFCEGFDEEKNTYKNYQYMKNCEMKPYYFQI